MYLKFVKKIKKWQLAYFVKCLANDESTLHFKPYKLKLLKILKPMYFSVNNMFSL